MRLALGPRDIDQVGLGQPRRLLQHGTGNSDVVILGEPPHRFDRSIAHGRELMSKLGARLGLDFRDQAGENAVEQTDVVLVEMLRAVEEERCDPLQGPRAPLGRAVLEDFLQFGDQRNGDRHS